MTTLKAIAIDDEPIALDIIRNHADKVPFLNLQKTFVSATEALMHLKKEPVQLVFLDINMPDITGIDFSNLLDPSVLVVFTTAYSEFAVKGFELNALDYLLKPITFNRFLQACQKAHDRLTEFKPNQYNFFVKDGTTLVRIDLENLLYVEADGNYLTIHEKYKKTTVRYTLTEMLNQLPNKDFVRINKSCIISVKKVDKIDNQYVMVNGERLLLVRSCRDALIAALK